MAFEFFENKILQAEKLVSISRKDCFCAFCKTPRKVYTKRRINFFNILGSAFGSLVLMYAMFQGFDPRVLLVFVVLLAVSEIFVQFRWRVTIVCRHCGFDPVLYIKNPTAAADKVKIRLERRKNDPASLLGPALNIATMKKKAEQPLPPSRTPKKGQRLSKQI